MWEKPNAGKHEKPCKHKGQTSFSFLFVSVSFVSDYIPMLQKFSGAVSKHRHLCIMSSYLIKEIDTNVVFAVFIFHYYLRFSNLIITLIFSTGIV